MKLSCWVLGVVSALLWATAEATPVVAVDLDPGTAGIQSSLSVEEGEGFVVEIVMDTDGNEVGNFEFDLAPGSVAGFPVVAVGIDVNELFGSGFLETLIGEETLDNGFGDAAGKAGSVLGTPANGSGLLLATLTYRASAPGTAHLDLNDVFLFDALGGALSPVVDVDGQVTVTPQSVGVPVPGVLWLLVSGLMILKRMRRTERSAWTKGRLQ